MDPLFQYEDHRGRLVELIGRHQVDNPIKHVYYSVTKPGETRANHHHKKKAEWVCVVEGTADVIVGDNHFTVCGDKPVLIDVPLGVWHSIKNIGDIPLRLIAIGSQPFDPDNPDTYTK